MRAYRSIAQINRGSDRAASPPTHCRHSTVFARWRQCARSLNTWLLVPTALTSPNNSSVQPFLYGRSPISPILHWAAPFPPKIAVYLLWSAPSFNIQFPGSTRTTIQSGISFELAIFPQYTLVTNGQIDRPKEQSRNSTGKNRLLALYDVRRDIII